MDGIFRLLVVCGVIAWYFFIRRMICHFFEISLGKNGPLELDDRIFSYIFAIPLTAITVVAGFGFR